MPNEKTQDEERRAVEREFTRIEAELAAQPGVHEVFRVYGTYETAERQVNEYFAALTAEPVFSTTNTSG